MTKKLKRIGSYFLYILYSNALYGLILWYTCTWLAGYSLVYAYLGNLALIILGLLLDELTLRMYRSERTARDIKKEKNPEKALRALSWLTDSFVSFKASLYLFYLLLLIISQIIEFNPTLAGENLSNFILATKYSILLLVAYDLLLEQFSKDRKRMRELSAKFKKYLTEPQD